MFGTVNAMINEFNNGNIGTINLGELYKMSNCKFGQSLNQYNIKDKNIGNIILTNSIDPLNEEYFKFINKNLQ